MDDAMDDDRFDQHIGAVLSMTPAPAGALVKIPWKDDNGVTTYHDRELLGWAVVVVPDDNPGGGITTEIQPVVLDPEYGPLTEMAHHDLVEPYTGPTGQWVYFLGGGDNE